MANEFRHADVIAGRLTEDEYEAINEHIANDQVADDMLYFNGTYWVRADPATIRTVLSIVKYTDAEAVSAVEAAGLALALGKNINVIQALTADHTWTGITAIMTAGRLLLFGVPCYIGNDGKLEDVLADAVATMPCMCIVVEGIVENATGEVLLLGFIRDNTWNWTPGGILYVNDDATGFTQTAPSDSGDQVQVVGVAVTADIIYFNPSLVLVELT